jgi:hypothetical protein
MHIAAVLHIIKQKGLDTKWRKLRRAAVRQSKMLKNLLKATGSRDTVSTNVDVQAHNMVIEQTQQMLQEAQKAHNEAMTNVYEQLRNLLSDNPQSQWDRIRRKMHEHDVWA